MTDRAEILRTRISLLDEMAAEARAELAGIQASDDTRLAELVERCHRENLPLVDDFLLRERHFAVIVGVKPETLKKRRMTGEEKHKPVTVDGVTHYDIRDLLGGGDGGGCRRHPLHPS